MEPSVILSGLMRRGIPQHIAQGIVANMMAESRLDPGINEENPLVEGSRGGFGLNQWTGPRRRQFEQFAQSQGRDLADPEVQLDFTLWELQNTERAAMQSLQGAETAEDAARIYSNKFLRPGIPHMDRRVSYANQLAGVEPSQNAFTTPTNALSAQEAGMEKMNMLAQLMPKNETPRQNAFQIERIR